MKIAKPKNFQVRLSDCGTDSLNSSYKIIKEKSALKLAYIVNNTMLKDFVRDEKYFYALKYHLACVLLNSIKGWNEKQLLKDIKRASKFFEDWELEDEASKNIKIKNR